MKNNLLNHSNTSNNLNISCSFYLLCKQSYLKNQTSSLNNLQKILQNIFTDANIDIKFIQEDARHQLYLLNLQALNLENLNLADIQVIFKTHQIEFDCIEYTSIQNFNQLQLIAFDMDSTLIEQECIDELAKFAGISQQVASITERAMQGELDFAQSFNERLALLANTPITAIEHVLKQLTFTDGTPQWLAWLNAKGVKTMLVSGGFTNFASYVQKTLNIEHIFAHQLSLNSAQTHLTGAIDNAIVDAQAKANFVAQIAAQNSINQQYIACTGDGANDSEMMKCANYKIAFKAKPALKKVTNIHLDYVGMDALILLWQASLLVTD